VRIAAAKELQQCAAPFGTRTESTPAFPELEKLLSDKNERVREAAIEALKSSAKVRPDVVRILHAHQLW
jgi:hypothetical protein